MDDKWLVTGPKVIELDGVSKLKVGIIGGQVDVIAHDEPVTRVEVRSVHGKELKVSFDGYTLEIDHPQFRWDNLVESLRTFSTRATVEVSILVPRIVRPNISVVGADVLVSGIHSDTSVNTVNGDIIVDACVGALTLNSVNAELTVRDHAGSVTVHTVNGDVAAAGELTRFSCDGVSNSVLVDSTGTPDQITINTVSGSVSIRLPEKLGGRFNVNTVSGVFELDGERIKNIHGKGHTTLWGDLDGKWVDTTCNTVSGSVSVVHRRETTPTDATPAAATA